MIKIFMWVILFYTGYTFPVWSVDPQGTSLRKQMEAAIQSCESQYQTIKLKEALLNPGPNPEMPAKPGLFSSKEKKNAYTVANEQLKKWESKKIDFDKKRAVFKRQLWDVAEFITKEKIKLRTLPESKIAEASRDFISNCKRFTDGVGGFADWSIGKGPQNIVIYQDWMKGK